MTLGLSWPLFAVTILVLAACSRRPEVDSGGCFIVKQTRSGEYVTAQLSKLGDEQDEVCGHIIKALER